ncbi:hypothetical protein [Alkalibacterium olivapovliticus]|nr:hypothetical protein [Alkalibacterium olivapovliticus]
MKMKFIKRAGKIFIYIFIGLIGGMGGPLKEEDSTFTDKRKQ